jgi:hypothetical protein
MSQITFVIYAPDRKPNVGGHVVIHMLIKKLADAGHEVWTTCKPLFPCRAKIIGSKRINDKIVWDTTMLSKKNYVAVYPETIKGNPLMAKNVVRWILYHTRPDIEETWSLDDHYFYYVDGFTTKRTAKKKILNLIDPKLDIFYNKGLGTNRSGYCHINKKKYPEGERKLEYLNSKDLSNFMENGGFPYLAEELNKHEYFVTYDDATYYSIAAALCGCKSVILNPRLDILPEEFRQQHFLFTYGVAYGWEDLKHADMTRDMVRDHIKRMEKNSLRQIEELVKYAKTIILQ